MDPDNHTRIAEIMSGRANFQQGLSDNLRRLSEINKISHSEDFGLAHEPVRAMMAG